MIPGQSNPAASLSEIPAFIVRSYPPFRMAQLHRVYVDHDALYVIRMRGIFGMSEAQRPRKGMIDLKDTPFHMALRWWVERSQASAARELDARGPQEMVLAHRGNLRVTPDEVVSSSLKPPGLLGSGEHFASWTLKVQDRRRLKFLIEDEASFHTALEHLPRLLGSALRVSVGWDAARGRPVRVRKGSGN